MKPNKKYLYLILFFSILMFILNYTYKYMYNLLPFQNELIVEEKAVTSIPEIEVEMKIKPVIENPKRKNNGGTSNALVEKTVSIIEKKDNKLADVLNALQLDRSASIESNLKMIIEVIPLDTKYLKYDKVRNKYLSLLNYALKEMPNAISPSNENYFCNSKNYIVSELESLNSTIDQSLILKINKICLK